MLTQLRSDIRKCSTRKEVVKLTSKHLRRETKECGVPLILAVKSSYGAVECIDGQTRHFDPFLNDEYIILRTVTGCDMSLVGLSTTDTDIEVTSDTVPSQGRKGYNTLLRAVAMMCAFVEGKAIRSEVSNAWSAYTLLKTYQTSAILKDGSVIHYTSPLTKEEALTMKVKCKQVFMRPTIINMEIATRIFLDTAVKCF